MFLFSLFCLSWAVGQLGGEYLLRDDPHRIAAHLCALAAGAVVATLVTCSVYDLLFWADVLWP